MPYGFIGRITNVINQGIEVIIETEPASLADAFSSLSIILSQTLNASDLLAQTVATPGVSIAAASLLAPVSQAQEEGFRIAFDDVVILDGDNNHATQNDQVRLNGSILVTQGYDFAFDIDGSSLTYLLFATNLSEDAEATVEVGISRDLIDEEVPFFKRKWNPIVVWCGWVPVTIVPELSLTLGSKGSISAGIEAGVRQSADITAGFSYVANSPSGIIADYSYSAERIGPTFSAGTTIRMFVGPRLDLLLFGLAGPYGAIDLFGELDVDIARVPIWQIFGGIEANGGVSVKALDDDLLDLEFPGVIQYRILLGEGGSGPQGVVKGIVKDAVTGQTLAGSAVSVFRGEQLIDTLLTGQFGEFSFPAQAGEAYRIEVTRTGYLPVSYGDITVLANEEKTLDVVLQIDEAFNGPGNISGKVVNALSGIGVPGLTVSLREGLNNRTGVVVASALTDATGGYSFIGLPAGNYTAQANGTAFIDSFFPVICVGYTSNRKSKWCCVTYPFRR